MVERPIGANLRRALEDKGWSYTRLIAEMRRVAARERVTLPTTRSLVVMLSRWFNDQERPSKFYQSILSKALGWSPAALGFVDSSESNQASVPNGFVADGIAAWGQLLGVAGANSTALSTAELLSGASWRSPHREPSAESTVVSGKVGAELLDTLDAMTEGYRRLDRQLGAASVFDDSTHHLQRITRLKDASMATEHRRRLAAAAGEVASLAAWQALDLGRPGAAWSYSATASACHPAPPTSRPPGGWMRRLWRSTASSCRFGPAPTRSWRRGCAAPRSTRPWAPRWWWRWAARPTASARPPGCGRSAAAPNAPTAAPPTGSTAATAGRPTAPVAPSAPTEHARRSRSGR
jgi:hypothetical protein